MNLTGIWPHLSHNSIINLKRILTSNHAHFLTIWAILRGEVLVMIGDKWNQDAHMIIDIFGEND